MSTVSSGVRTRVLAGVALAAVVIVALVLILGGGSDYKVNIIFVDAGQLVHGDLVEVGGQTVGKIDELKLTKNGEADVVMHLSGKGVDPLHQGTTATIRTVGLSGVANRFIELDPGPSSAPAIPNNGVLGTTETEPIVDLDQLLDSLDAPARANLKGLIHESAQIFASASPADANASIHYFNPAIGQARALLTELGTDQHAIETLITSGATVASALANRRDDLQGAITNTATVLRSLAGERAKLADALTLLPGVLTHGTRTVRRATQTLAHVRPVLREARPVAAPLAEVLRQLAPTTQQAVPVLTQVNQLLPGLQKALAGLPSVAHVGVPALHSTTKAIKAAYAIVVGLRPYAPDIVHGAIEGLGGAATAYYDANGHYARISPVIGGGSQTGLLNSILNGLQSSGAGYRKGDVAPCPGSSALPAADKSNPFLEQPQTCDQSEDATG